jgi:hypothetical protein
MTYYHLVNLAKCQLAVLSTYKRYVVEGKEVKIKIPGNGTRSELRLSGANQVR